jgi:N-acetylglucosaminyl-diphospho-decaprenol L-rhamnosyltransferase
MTPDVSAIVVSHRSAAEASACVASLRRAFAEEGLAGEVVLVDCGSGEEEAGRLRAIPADRHLLLAENRGYSGGVNAGLAQARGAGLLLSNADIVFDAGAVTALLGAIRERSTGAAAPLAVWDSGARLRLPPGFAPGFFRDLAQLQSGRLRALDDRRFASFARAARRLWERGGRARHLSGAVLAVRRDVFDAAGRFDERFPFEYEETEWEDRVRSKGYDLVFVPGARVRHLWAVSASRNPETGERRRESRRLYRRRRYGRLGRALLESAERFPPSDPGVTKLAEPRLPARPGAAVALSPNPSGLPFAAADLSEDFRLPDEVAAGLAPGPWYLTVFRTADGRPIQRFLWLKASA